MSLKTKNVLVTGGAAGLGKSFIDVLLAAGAKVFFGDINASEGEKTEREFQDKYGKDTVKLHAVDCTDRTKFEEAFAAAVNFLGHIDLMVNNAGMVNESDFEKVIRLNYMAVVHGTYMAADHMRKDKGGKGGRIVNMSSILGLEPNVTVPVYSGTKHAVRAFTESMSIAPDLEQQAIEYAVLCPTTCATNLVKGLDATKIRYIYTQTKQDVEARTAPIECIQRGFMKLISLEEMNGAILYASKTELTFRRMENVCVGESWPVKE